MKEISYSIKAKLSRCSKMREILMRKLLSSNSSLYRDYLNQELSQNKSLILNYNQLGEHTLEQVRVLDNIKIFLKLPLVLKQHSVRIILSFKKVDIHYKKGGLTLIGIISVLIQLLQLIHNL